MVATPARISLSINDGVVLSKVDATIKAAHPNAVDETTEVEMFFDTAADGQVLLDERWAWRSAAGRPREQVEFDSSFGLGTSVVLTPALPTLQITDEDRAINQVVTIVRAYSIDYGSERYAVELAG